jgi:hypothetical protein
MRGYDSTYFEGVKNVSSIGGYSLSVHCHRRAGEGCGRTGSSGWGDPWRGNRGVIGGVLGGGRGAAVGAVVGGVTGAAIAAQGQARPGGYRYYQQACYQQRGDGAWIAVAPQYCAPAAAAPVAVAPRVVRDELGDRMLLLREGCEDGDRRACVRLGILIGENRERRAAWRREHPEVFFYER